MYQTVRAALLKRNGSVTDAEIRAVLGDIDSARYDTRNKRAWERPPKRMGATEIAERNRRKPHQRERLPAGKASGSYGATSTRPWRGGWRGARAGTVVTNQNGPLPKPPPIPSPRPYRSRRRKSR